MKLFFDRAAKKTGIPADYLDIIKACDTVVRFNIPLVRDNGTLETVTCYRYALYYEGRGRRVIEV